ncbi:MAG: DinB family protein [Acidobacteria bacterium]|nr:DinB family protein [Acidobacteriota bacterium]
MNKSEMKGLLGGIKEFFDRSTRALTEEDSNFTPAEGMFTAAQQVAHVAQTVEWFVDGAFAPDGFPMDWEGMDKQIRAVNSLAEARAWVDRAFAHANAVIDQKSEQEWAAPLPAGPIMGGLPRSYIFGSLNDHTAHHRGALSVYTRLRGKVPPMPYMDM